MATLVQPRAPAPTTTPEPKPRAPTVAPTEQSRAPAAAQTEQPRAPAAAPTVVEQPREAPAAVDTKEAATTTRTATGVHADHASGRKDSTCIESKFPVLVVVGVQFFSLFVSFVFRVSSFVSWTVEVDCVLHLMTNVCVCVCVCVFVLNNNRSAIVTRIKRVLITSRSCEKRKGRDNRWSSQRKSWIWSPDLSPFRKQKGWSSCCNSTGNTTNNDNVWQQNSRNKGRRIKTLCVSHVQNLRSKTLGAFACVYVCVSLVMSESEKQMKKKQNPRSSPLSLSQLFVNNPWWLMTSFACEISFFSPELSRRGWRMRRKL